MGAFAGPEIAESGLVLALDAANTKGFDDDENLLAYSEDFSNAYWAKSNVSVTSNAIASPTGSSNASKLVESATTAVHELNRSADPVLSSGLDNYITFSIFAKAAERQYCYIRATGNTKRIAAVVDLSNGTFNVTNWSFTLNSSATVTAYPNGWYRITATAQSNYPPAPGWFGAFYVSPLDTYQSAGNVGGSGYSYAGNGTSGIYIWGAHYEFGPGISDYYATTGTIKNRGTTWSDLSGRVNNGTLTNGPTYSSANGGSIVFDGTNDFINCGTGLALSGSWTISGFVRSSVSSAAQVIIQRSGDGSTSYAQNYVIYIQTNNKFRCGTDADSYKYAESTTTMVINTWYYVTGLYNATTKILSIYVNGIFEGSSTALVGNPTTTGEQYITLGAGDGLTIANRLTGNIAQASIYNRALSAQEIQQNFNATRGRYGI